MIDEKKLIAEIEGYKSAAEHFLKYKDNLGQWRTQKDLCDKFLSFINSMQEEPVSEFPNTESMIESYKQRLISQANGVENSPLIDMCLASYKHGINETLDTINLSNIQRIGKNWKEPVSEDLKKVYQKYVDHQIERIYPNLSPNLLRQSRMTLKVFDGTDIELAFEAGAKWQKQARRRNK